MELARVRLNPWKLEDHVTFPHIYTSLLLRPLGRTYDTSDLLRLTEI